MAARFCADLLCLRTHLVCRRGNQSTERLWPRSPQNKDGALRLDRWTKMTSTTSDYLEDNAAKREWSRIFAEDITSPEGRCAHQGAIRRFAEHRTPRTSVWKRPEWFAIPSAT